MKNIFASLLLTLLLNFCLIAQSDTQKPYWENPVVFEENQTSPHAFKLSYNSIDEAIEDNKAGCPNFQSLNGQWKFIWLETPEQVPEDFFSSLIFMHAESGMIRGRLVRVNGQMGVMRIPGTAG